MRNILLNNCDYLPNKVDMVHAILLLVVLLVKYFTHPDSIGFGKVGDEEVGCACCHLNSPIKIRFNDTKSPVEERFLKKYLLAQDRILILPKLRKLQN